MKAHVIVAVWAISATATIGLAATARADTSDQEFQSPSGNIACWLRETEAGCDNDDYTHVPPNPLPGQQVPVPCSDGDVIRFHLDQGYSPGGYCQPGALPLTDIRAPDLQTLDYGQTRFVGAMTCDSQPSRMTCTDTGTRYFFRVSRES